MDNQKEGEENKHLTEIKVKKSGSDNETLTPNSDISKPLSNIFGNFKKSLMSVLGKKDGSKSQSPNEI